MVAKKPGGTNRQRAYDYVRTGIVSLDLPPGSTLSENALAAELGMSRTPVREAIMLLAEEDLVHVLPQIGSFVARVDPARVAEAQFLREAVELASLRSVTTPVNPDALGRLEENLKQQDSVDEDTDRFFELDEAFHRELMTLAGHEASWGTVAGAKSHLDRARRLGIREPGAFRERVAEHHAVFDAVVAGDLAQAEELLSHHLRVVFEDIRVVERELPQFFVTDPAARPMRRSVIVWEAPELAHPAPPSEGP